MTSLLAERRKRTARDWPFCAALRELRVQLYIFTRFWASCVPINWVRIQGRILESSTCIVKVNAGQQLFETVPPQTLRLLGTGCMNSGT